MAVYQRGSLGAEVVTLQKRLQELGWYRGPLDGRFGGGTEGAARAFQRSRKLTPDGRVGPRTWGALFAGETIPTPRIASKPLDFRVLALTASFETDAPVPECFCGLSGDFDGQGISFGVLQWNFGQGSLQPLLSEMLTDHPAPMKAAFHVHLPVLRAVLKDSLAGQLDWARSVQTPAHRINEPWAGMFKSLGRSEEFQQIELEHAGRIFRRARTMCGSYGLTSERGVALMFDVITQNGGIGRGAEATIRQEMKELATGSAPDLEVGRMRIIAVRRAEAALPRWIADVRARKLTIAEGAGMVHGKHYDLAEMYGLTLQPF
jgi:hypothetical protein